MYKPKTEHCFHTRFKFDNSWEAKISWKNFNKRYRDFIDQCEACQSKYPCPPYCDCGQHPKFSIPCTTCWALNGESVI